MTATHDQASIGRRAGRGLRWSLGGTAVTKIGSFAMTLVMARLLAPEDFGVFAIALAATHFAMHVNDMGIIAAVVQWRGRFEDVAPTATALAAVFGIGWYGVFWLTAPLLAEVAGNPDATSVIRVLTILILIDGLTAVRTGWLQRSFQQDQLMKAIMAGFVANATVAIAFAANGFGAMSFAVGSVAEAVVTGVLVYRFAAVPWRVAIDRAVARRLMVFGIPLAASWGVEAVLLNIDYVVVGSALGAAALGFYLLAFNISSWAPGVITTAIRYVSLSGFSRMAEQGELSSAVQRTIPLLVTGIIPIAVVMGVLAEPVVLFLYGPTWAPAAPVLACLTVLMVVRMLSGFAVDAVMGAGATRWTLWIHLGWTVALVPALLVGVRLDGLRGAAVAHGVVAVLVALPLSALALNRVGVRLAPIGPALVRPLLAGLVATAAALAVRVSVGDTPALGFFLGGTAVVASFVLVVVPRADLWRALRLIAARLSTRAETTRPETTSSGKV